ncbi:MAG TPA: winged helix-turn-helix domain-containing protein [Nitrososphaera sp.]|nr:winged helix-turn-helix domain-containing protein [Nitrososphaera sp.]
MPKASPEEVNSERRADKRGSFDICADMLKVLDAEFECNKAALAIKSNLDSRAMSKYLEILIKYELVSKAAGDGRPRIRISEKGRSYLNQYVRMIELLE